MRNSQVLTKQTTIFVVGDKDVGKSTLINNYVSDAKTQAVEFAEESELIRIVKKATLEIQNPENPDEHTNINVTFVDVEGTVGNVHKQIRDGYFKTSEIILMIYNVRSCESLYNASAQWQTEMKEAWRFGVNEDDSDRVQLYLVGVNPEARNECEILKEEDFEYDTQADEVKKDLFRRRSQLKSVNQQSAEKIARRLSVGKSTKAATHKEVKTTKADIERFFSDLVSNYVYPAGN